ncbi:dihydrolipoyl dehydrogenase family protein [Paenibacillus pini]|uniref:Similar to glutathione reductase n=1 Tax=Paenibacillus pini JCM 16418 TaxID=1236976 RepID=W7YG61_9BACL|nr:NAD(P)/FAD-dependent oxidoreductase [Paenibacillus pini]GAF06538.1 similar to glutathione reductase [Paenibacillus pini JCM 16418]
MENTLQTFDLIVIGTGTAASSAAAACAKAGWKVAMTDELSYGGTCSLRGCDPKKVLVGAAEIIDWTERMKGNGIDSHASISWPELMAFKRTFTEPMPDASEESFKKSGIHTFHGTATFVGEDQIQIGDDLLNGKYILIASGAKSAPMTFEGSEYLTLSDDFLDLKDLPKRLVFIGGGYISFEFAHIAARAGAEVHILHRGERPLEGFDPDLVDLLLQKTEELGIQVHLNIDVNSITKNDKGYVVQGTCNNTEHSFDCDLAIHGAGRVPNLENLNLDKGNVEREKKGVSVNAYLQSISNPRVYAAGDAAATSGLPLTPVASLESRSVASNLLEGNHSKPNYKEIPSVVFTIPKLASVGMNEAKALEDGYDIQVNKQDMSGWYTYKRTNEKYAMAKVIIDKPTQRILGAHILGSGADELINHFATAIQFDLTVDDLKSIVFAYPSTASNLADLL